MPDETVAKSESRTGLYLIGIGILIVLCIIALSFFVPNEDEIEKSYREGQNTALIWATTNTSNALKDLNRNDIALAQLIVESNYRMSCVFDDTNKSTIEVPQADSSYRRYTKFSAVYCPQQGGG